MESVVRSARELREDDHESLVRRLAMQSKVNYSRSDDTGQVGAWRNSLPVLFDLLCSAGLGHVQVILEHPLPFSPKRVDAVLCGVHPTTGSHSYVLVELKQWSEPTVVAPRMVKVLPNDEQPVLHPAEQVRRYCRYLVDFMPSLSRNQSRVKGVAYLHNATRRPGWNLDELDCGDFGRLYTQDQVLDLTEDLRTLLDDDPATADAARVVAMDLVDEDPKPVRPLLKAAAEAMERREGFVLLDRQKVAFDAVWHAVGWVDQKYGQDDWRKKVVIVRGGPGSGKSAIAIGLMSALAERLGKVLHATGSRAFTETLWKYVAGNNERTMDLFKYFNYFKRIAGNSIDVLICDEAHRIRNTQPSQIAQLIDVAKVPVFLLDDHQTVRPSESCTVNRIYETAEAMGCQVEKIDLDGHFRCAGSRFYDDWVLRLLGLKEGGPIAWSDFVAGTNDDYGVDSVEAPHALDDWLRLKMDNFGGEGRISAGFCWDWHDPIRKDGVYKPVDDVQIGGWKRPWNIRQGCETDGYPSASLWASDPDGFGQIGCIYTAQGFEYDWSGVIFGEDLVIRKGRWEPQPSKSKDKSVNRLDPAMFSQLVRNTYKVLMTRGMFATCVYSVDPETNEFLRRYCH
ncbi:DUF2075 domain-containing protein [Pseudonocardiaceae bacterium YIM PH 21723]|nr:DUF2075 domain-containing protein [Pseudonocardiaceae bacterium YIM PH 21723]